jgi:hypothetical protein
MPSIAVTMLLELQVARQYLFLLYIVNFVILVEEDKQSPHRAPARVPTASDRVAA